MKTKNTEPDAKLPGILILNVTQQVKIIVKDYDVPQSGDTIPPDVKKDEKGYYIEILF
jgi:hypothetical protein